MDGCHFPLNSCASDQSAMSDPTTPRYRWFRFSLRTLFVLVTLLSIFLGFVGVQIKWIHDRHTAEAWVRRHHALGASSVVTAPAPWSIRVFGEAEGPRYID